MPGERGGGGWIGYGQKRREKSFTSARVLFRFKGIP